MEAKSRSKEAMVIFVSSLSILFLNKSNSHLIEFIVLGTSLILSPLLSISLIRVFIYFDVFSMKSEVFFIFFSSIMSNQKK
jgi:hypothetical protein